MKNIWSILALGLVLAGCGQFYWSRPAATLDDFATDHRACVRAVGVSSGPRYDGAMPKGENVGAAGKAVAIGVGVLTLGAAGGLAVAAGRAGRARALSGMPQGSRLATREGRW